METIDFQNMAGTRAQPKRNYAKTPVAAMQVPSDHQYCGGISRDPLYQLELEISNDTK